jgi:hypothetical protein
LPTPSGRWARRRPDLRRARLASYRPGFDYADDFHTFAVKWTAEQVVHYVDDFDHRFDYDEIVSRAQYTLQLHLIRCR